MNWKKILAGCVVGAMVLNPATAFAANDKLISGDEAAAMLIEHRAERLQLQTPNEGTGAVLPEKFDLREKGVVTPVKLQNPFGTCWGFSAIAAAETSILSEMGKTYEETGLDLSEHHLTYFSRVALADGSSQNGEGWYVTDGDLFNTGGCMYMASSVFASGIGVTTEEKIPYRGKNGTPNSYYVINIGYSDEDDWTLPEEYRFFQQYELEESVLLPSPAVYQAGLSDEAGNWERQQAYLGYDATATELMKQELLAGRAISIAFSADQSMPNQKEEPMYLNANDNKWTHYTFDGGQATHAVTIVGWDDTIPASDFIDHSNDKYGDGLPHQPEGDGAWIVKNSWGAATEKFPNYMVWGIENEDGDSTGYFYLSYYDRSITMPETFDFNITGNKSGYVLEQYDYLPTDSTVGWLDNTSLKMANIFVSETDAVLRSVSCETAHPNTDVTYEVYLMDDGMKVPDEGRLMATEMVGYPFAGYHRVELQNTVPMQEGQRYAIVVTQKVMVEDTEYYGMNTNSALNKAGLDAYNYAVYAEHHDEGEKAVEEHLLHTYAVGIVNAGESMVYIGELNGWADLADLITEYNKIPEFANVDFDNFPIKGYLDPTDTALIEAERATMPDLVFVESNAGLINIGFIVKALLAALAVLALLIALIVWLVRRNRYLKAHPEKRKPGKKQLRQQLELRNQKIAELEQQLSEKE